MKKTRTPALLLVANYDSETGYAWNNIYSLYNYIARQFNASGVAICASFKSITYPLQVFDPDIPLSVFEYDPDAGGITPHLKLLGAVRRYRIKYIYMTDMPTYSVRYLLLRATGVRHIVHSRVSVADPRPAPSARGFRGLLKCLAGRVRFVRPDTVYTVSEFVRQRYATAACFPQDRLRCILNGIDTRKFQQPSHRRSNPDTLTVFMGSRASYYKGVHVLIEAAQHLRSRYPDLEFRMRYAGDGPDLERFKDLVKDLGLSDCFEFLGALVDVRDELAAADIVAVPSVWGDACPSAVSEALAAGKPTVTTNAGGIPEIIGECGAAEMVPPGDSEALANVLAKLLGDAERRAELGQRGRRRAADALDRERYHADVVSALADDFGVPLR